MGRALLVLLPLLLAGGAGFVLGARRPRQLRTRLASALPVVTACRALAEDVAVLEPAQHRLHQLQAREALEGWDRAALGP